MADLLQSPSRMGRTVSDTAARGHSRGCARAIAGAFQEQAPREAGRADGPDGEENL